MPAEIVFDDGGSTRIKQLGKKLDDLMEVDPNAVGSGPVPGAPGSKVKALGVFNKLRVVTVDNNGALTEQEHNLVADNSFQLVSKGQQRIHGKIVAAVGSEAAHCLLTVYGISDVEPIISAKQTNGQRRYVIENAGRIIQVEVPGTDRDIDPAAIAYTTVFLKKV